MSRQPVDRGPPPRNETVALETRRSERATVKPLIGASPTCVSSPAQQQRASFASTSIDCYSYPVRLEGRLSRRATASPSHSGRSETRRSASPPSLATLSPIRGRTAEEAMRNYLPSRSQSRENRQSVCSSQRRTFSDEVTTVDPTEFSMEIYRQLHQRRFKSASEELFFLRRDFVSSRKTLAILHDETVRLKAELQGRVDEIVDLNEKVDGYRRQLDRLQVDVTAQENASCGKGVFARRLSSASGRSSGREDGEEETRSATPRESAGHNEEGSATSARPFSTSAVSLFATAGAATARHRKNAKGKRDGVDNEVNTVDLINELRRNLAKRDTALDRCRMEVGEANQARDALERECRQAKLESSQTRREQQSTLAALNEKMSALEALEQEVKALRAQSALKDEELAKLRKKGEIAELLGEFPAAKTVDGGLTEHEYLFDQVKTYRERWQAAEDRIDELSRRQLSLSSHEHHLPIPATATTAAVDTTATLSEAAKLRMETEIRDQAETIRRLQRKMEREEESAAFRAEQNRQQRQEDLRQHALEVAALREQLQAARQQLLNEAKDRESLTRQLRQATHTETMTDTLQSQNHSLKQRLAEMTAELAQVHGREKELEVSVQREIGERMRLGRENDSLYTQQKEADRKASVLRETVEDLSRRLGAAEAKAFAFEQLLILDNGSKDALDKGSIHRPPSYLGSLAQGDGAAMASEQKGYVALMNRNITLEAELQRMERKLQELQITHNVPESGSRHDNCMSNQGRENEEDVIGRQRAHLAVEVSELREELRRARSAQASLFSTLTALQKEHEEILQDNVLLANGAEFLHKKLLRARSVKCSDDRKEIGCSTSPGQRKGSHVRRKLQLAKNYAEEEGGPVADATRSCAPPPPSYATPETRVYAQQLKKALTAAQQQVTILTNAIDSLPATPLKTCSPHVDCALPPGEKRHSPCPSVHKQLFSEASLSGSNEAIVTISQESCRPNGEIEGEARTAAKDLSAASPSLTTTTTTVNAKEAMPEAAGKALKSKIAALKRELKNTRSERDHWRSLVDRYTVVCTSTIDL